MNKLKFTIEEMEKEDIKITEEKDYDFIDNSSINQFRSDMGFKTLVDGFNELLFVIPKYQRKYVWSKEQVENLAASLVRGLPIPPIYVYRNDKGQLEILDGQQRMLSLFLYYKGKYIKNSTNTQVELQKLMRDSRLNSFEVSFEELLNEVYPLKDVTYNLKYRENNIQKNIDITYKNLPDNIKRRINFAPISVIEIKVDDTKYKNRALYKVFENLNSGGTELKNQELRNGIYQCEFYDMLHEINRNNTKWRDLQGEEHKHSRDVELLLRFASVDYYFKLVKGRIIINNYNNSYPQLLNDFSDEALNFDKNIILKYKEKIEKFIDRIKVKEKLPNLLLESLYLASIYIDGDYEINQQFCDYILSNEKYQECTLSSSSSKSKVKTRLNYVYEQLLQYVDGNKKQNNK